MIEKNIDWDKKDPNKLIDNSDGHFQPFDVFLYLSPRFFKKKTKGIL